MSKVKNLALAFTIGLLAISCGDDDSNAPVVTISSPAAASSYTVADTLILIGTVTEDEELASILISSDFGLSESVTTFDSDTSHALNYNITFDPATAVGDYTLTVTATDEAGNVGTDDVQITVQ
jgi:hypothetical protein